MSEISVAVASSVGSVREQNEDSFWVGRRIWAVADGMGGMAAGRVASQIAVRQLEACDDDGINQEQIMAVLERANQEILDYGQEHPQAAGLGTTLSGIALVSLAYRDHWLVFNLGDSRVYRLSQGRLTQQTTDHSETQHLVDRGVITREEARTHPHRNVLTRCLGSHHLPRVDMRLIPYQSGDRFMICSDGLTSEIEDDTIEAILLAAPGPEQAVDSLIEAALDMGGRDNVTVVVVDVHGPDNQERGGLLEDTLPTLELEDSYAGT